MTVHTPLATPLKWKFRDSAFTMRYLTVLLLAIPLSAQHPEQQATKKKNPAIGNLQAIAAGKSLFLVSCSGCHGANGEGGRGPNLLKRVAWHPMDDDQLFTTIQKGVPGADMPPTNLPEEQIWQLSAFVRSLTAPAFEQSVPGDPAAGEKVFWGKAGCSQCHLIRGRGGRLGPDLSNAGMLPLQELRQAVLDPSATIALGYRGVKVTLRGGRSLEGVARNRTNYSIQVQDAQGVLHLISARDVQEIVLAEGSPMPRDFGTRLSKEELTDLLTFLSRQSMRPRQDSKEGN